VITGREAAAWELHVEVQAFATSLRKGISFEFPHDAAAPARGGGSRGSDGGGGGGGGGGGVLRRVRKAKGPSLHGLTLPATLPGSGGRRARHGRTGPDSARRAAAPAALTAGNCETGKMLQSLMLRTDERRRKSSFGATLPPKPQFQLQAQQRPATASVMREERPQHPTRPSTAGGRGAESPLFPRVDED